MENNKKKIQKFSSSDPKLKELYMFCIERHTEDEIRECIDQNYEYFVYDIGLFSVLISHNVVSEKLLEEINILTITPVWTTGRLDWILVVEYQKLSESFIDRYCKYFDKRIWSAISVFQKLSESFIEKHEKEVNWNNICKYQVLSDEFIIKYKSKLNSSDLSRYQVLSEDTIWKYRKSLDLDYIIHNHPLISETFKSKLILYTLNHN